MSYDEEFKHLNCGYLANTCTLPKLQILVEICIGSGGGATELPKISGSPGLPSPTPCATQWIKGEIEENDQHDQNGRPNGHTQSSK